MITKRINKDKSKKLIKHNKRRHNKNYINRDGKKTKRVLGNQSGGGVSGNGEGKERFEVRALEDMDISALNLSKYSNANIDWGIMPGPPPMDCVIL